MEHFDPPRRTSSVAPPLVAVCGDLARYAELAASFDADAPVLPVLHAAPSLLGFPAGTRVAAAETLAGAGRSRSPVAGDPARVIFSVDEPSCVAVARFLAGSSERSMIVASEAAWEQLLAGCLVAAPSSLTIVVPAWDGDGKAAPQWVGRALLAMRRHHRLAARTSWGLLTGATPAALSVMAAKAVVQPAIVASYADAPSVCFTTDTAESVWATIPLISDARAGLLRMIDRRHVLDGSASAAVGRPLNLLMFMGHGRMYCACQGYLCGARTLADAPDAPLERCVLGMECASPRQDAYAPGFPAFPRIDPRRYDAPVMILDCCGAGNWSSPVWDAGIPSLAFHAAAGAPGAIILSDQVTMSRAGGYLEVLWALVASATVGEAVARLNHVREGAAAEFPFFLFGDPECPAGASRWPSWCRYAEVLGQERGADQTTRTLARVRPGAPFVRVPMPVDEDAVAHTTFVLPPDGVEVASSMYFRGWDRAELWIDARAVAGGDAAFDLLIEHQQTPALPPALLEAALALDRRRRSWTPVLLEQVEPLRVAAERIIKVAAMTRRLERRAVSTNPEDIRAAISFAHGSWQAAQAELVRHTVDRLRTGGLWPFRLWTATDFTGESIAEPCPYCGLVPTLLRRYGSPPSEPRLQWECMRCVLIEDRPNTLTPRLALRVPDAIHTGETITAELLLDNREGALLRSGAARILVDMLAHGVEADPSDPINFEIPPGEAIVVRVALTLPADPAVHHRYWVRAVVLIDGEWFLAARQISVAPGQGAAAG